MTGPDEISATAPAFYGFLRMPKLGLYQGIETVTGRAFTVSYPASIPR